MKMQLRIPFACDGKNVSRSCVELVRPPPQHLEEAVLFANKQACEQTTSRFDRGMLSSPPRHSSFWSAQWSVHACALSGLVPKNKKLSKLQNCDLFTALFSCGPFFSLNPSRSIYFINTVVFLFLVSHKVPADFRGYLEGY